jgi:transcriptional regulator with XRE-family HTH domain
MTPDQFKYLRKELTLTQVQCADLLGCKERIIRRYEHGESPIPNVIGKYFELYKYTRNIDARIISALCSTILDRQTTRLLP